MSEEIIYLGGIPITCEVVERGAEKVFSLVSDDDVERIAKRIGDYERKIGRLQNAILRYNHSYVKGQSAKVRKENLDTLCAALPDEAWEGWI